MGEKLRAARKAAGLTQAQLAEKAGYTQRDVSRWESGVVEPVASTVRKLADALGCPADAII